MTDQELLDRYFLARLLWWRQNIINLEDAAIMELVATLNEVRLEIGNELALFEWEKERLEALAAYCDDLIAAATVKTAQVVSSATVSAGAASLTNWATMLSVGGAAANISFVEMSPAQIKSWFQDTPLGGHSLNEWVKKAFDEGIRKELLTSLRKSGVKGEGYGPMVKNLMQAALDNGAELTERNAITIARTYAQTANVEAQRAVYRQNTDVVYAQKWTSVLDNRVCPRCAALDGAVYKNGEEMPPIPLHPRCRCLLLPCVRVDELGVTSEDLERVARPWVVREHGNIDAGGTRKILLHGSSKEDFGGWYKTLPEKERVRIVGPVRAKLLADGKIAFGELVDKKTGNLRSLADLGYNEKGKFMGFEQILANVRKGAMPNYCVDLEQHFASLDTATATHQVGEYFRAGFPQWRKSPQGNIPIAVLDGKDMDAIGAESRIAMLSAETMRKQERKHPELALKDYARVQEIMQRGERYQQSPKKMAFMVDDSDGLAVVIKATKTGGETYISSLWKLSSKDFSREKAIRKLKKSKK